ncbi:uncharacterized protein TRIVIDRAFT_55585 [Trichoderma virens Gv29-8]|uniref:Letm1 RBD domain-containing protein n=1 Tax=Hypocrea virens (strain Gv29-8 / FGSC 10586) TaxID=413071 RepID=G9MHL3_HYPVG|nr:uncharacterized protein TRIVIDRAFT_55585 [Trichoderma virens Gv29-8]EHK26201.1 hypothetical protein TRIVIDRAFT_55585 [Trichoderma virens Gv29-8]UKZ46387.1 hypothetical protein TrVGV298_000588 [Trichoderma virens]
MFRTSRALHQSRVLGNDKGISPRAKRLASVNAVLNPPASTRPPPLLPVEPQESKLKYYFQLGKSYAKFFAQGVKAVVANARLLNARAKSLPRGERPSVFRPHYIPDSFSRADWVLLWRTRHDLLRLPVFALFFLVAGEFTPILVVFVSGILPYTCRFPSLLNESIEKAERRRATAFDELESKHPQGVLSPGITKAVARKHVLRALDLPGAMWDRLGFTPPGMWNVKGRLRLSFLEVDDKRLIDGGGPSGLEVEELRIACSDRGLNIRGKSEAELRIRLGDWLRLTAAEELGERRRRMATLMLTRPENWPQQRNFAVPEWEL